MHNIGENVKIAYETRPKTASSGANNGAGVNMSLYSSVSFCIMGGTFATNGKLNAKLQWRDGFTGSWTDETGSNGNSTAITEMTASGEKFLHVKRPEHDEYRVVTTPSTANVTFAVFSYATPIDKPVSAA